MPQGIEQRDQHEDRGGPGHRLDGQAPGQLAHQPHGDGRRARQGDDVGQRRLHHHPADEEEQRRLGHGLEHLDQVVDAEHLLDTLDRVHVIELRRELLEGEHGARLQEIGEQPDGGHRHEQHRGQQQGQLGRLPGEVACGAGEAGMHPAAAERGEERLEQLGDARGGEVHRQRAQAQPYQQHDGAGHFLALGDVALLARVVQLLLGRLLGLVAAVVLVGHGGDPSKGAASVAANPRQVHSQLGRARTSLEFGGGVACNQFVVGPDMGP